MENENVNFFGLIVDNAGNFFKGICEILTFVFIFFTPHFLHSSFSTFLNFHTPYSPPLAPVALVGKKKNLFIALPTSLGQVFYSMLFFLRFVVVWH